MYSQSEKLRRPLIFPPKPSVSQNNQNNESRIANNIDAKDLNKNVYLQRTEDVNHIERSSTETIEKLHH